MVVAKTYITISEEPIAAERLDDDGQCQPSFYIIGVMKGASTHMAEVLAKAGVMVHHYEHHFWESYPALKWERGDDASHCAGNGELESRTAEAESALVRALRHSNGSYPLLGYQHPGVRLCVDLLKSLAPRSLTNLTSATQSACSGARGTLATSLVLHHNLLHGDSWLSQAATLAASERARHACQSKLAIGIKAPSHIRSVTPSSQRMSLVTVTGVTRGGR